MMSSKKDWRIEYAKRCLECKNKCEVYIKGGCLPCQNKQKEIFEPNFEELFKKYSNDIWGRLLTIDQNLKIFHTISSSGVLGRTHHFSVVSYDMRHSLIMMMGALVYESIMGIFSLLYDTNTKSLTFDKFTNLILNGLKKEYRDCFQKDIQKFKKGKEHQLIVNLGKKILPRRHKYLIHRNVKEPEKEEPDTIPLRKYEVDFTTLNNLLDVSKLYLDCCTGSGHIFPNEPSNGIQQLIDLAIKNGYINRPDKDWRWWRFSRPNLCEKEISFINELRIKYGMKPIEELIPPPPNSFVV